MHHITAISNVGPRLGSKGSAGNFANLTDFAKNYLTSLMLIGRLEIFTILSLFIPGFWKIKNVLQVRPFVLVCRA